MSHAPDATHAPALASWVGSANDAATDFPIQNLPFGRFRAHGERDWRVGVAIGDQVLDLARAGLVEAADMSRLLCLGAEARQALRRSLSDGLRAGSAHQPQWSTALVAQSQV